MHMYESYLTLMMVVFVYFFDLIIYTMYYIIFTILFFRLIYEFSKFITTNVHSVFFNTYFYLCIANISSNKTNFCYQRIGRKEVFK